MEPSSTTAAGGSGGGGPAPFLVKTYEMVDDPATDAVVSWGDSSESTFVVWNPPEFAAHLLPTYFKHNNFSSFIRQLNTYGFRKSDPERWEFSNDFFVKGQKHLLKNIHRRKPVHSHSLLPGSLPDTERAALEEEIDRLTRERNTLEADLWRFNQQQSGAIIQIEDLERRVLDMEQRQLKMVAFLHRAGTNPRFVQNLVKMAETSSVFTDAIQKKRRLPGVNYSNEIAETSYYDDHSSISKQDDGNLFTQDFCNMLRLELCPAMPESNLVTASTQSSHQDNGSPHGKQTECERISMECLPLVPETMDLSDTGTSLCPSKNPCLVDAINEEGLLPCHLSLTLASCSMETDKNQYATNTNLSTGEQAADSLIEMMPSAITSRQDGLGRLVKNTKHVSSDSGTADVATSQKDSPVGIETPAVAPARVNDLFWEQFLTERPGSLDTEEASSSVIKTHKEGEEDIEQLKL